MNSYTRTKKNNTNTNRKFEQYLLNDFNPAQAWAASPVGINFIKTNIPSLEALRPKENKVLAAAYEILINNSVVYVGQSLRTIRRLYTHAYHLATEPYLYFGILPAEITSIEVRISTPPIFNESSRLAMEAALVRNQKPVLQPYSSVPGMQPDACLPRGRARRDAMIAAGVIN